MDSRMLKRSGRAMLGAVVLACGALVTPFTVGGAHADIGVCRTDPVIQLTNGTTVSVTAAINDLPGDISGVSFFVVLPSGSQVQSISYPGGQMPNETVTILTLGNNYMAGTFVGTAANSAGVTVNMQVSTSGSDTESGSSNSLVVTQVSR